MRYFKSSIREKMAGIIGGCSHALLLLDYDGTLTPIVSKPGEAKLRSTVLECLKALAQRKLFTVGVITGRSVAQMKHLLPVKNVLIAGNHGLELMSPNKRVSYHYGSEFVNRIKEIKSILQPLEEKFPGSYLEDKEISIAYHFRLANPNLSVEIKNDFFRAILPWVKKRKIRVLKIKKGWEVLPPIQWDKGNAVFWILNQYPKTTFSLFVGDDLTDESAFKAMNPYGVTIRVGKKKGSSAQYFVKNVYEVEKFLSALADKSQRQSAKQSNYGT